MRRKEKRWQLYFQDKLCGKSNIVFSIVGYRNSSNTYYCSQDIANCWCTLARSSSSAAFCRYYDRLFTACNPGVPASLSRSLYWVLYWVTGRCYTLERAVGSIGPWWDCLRERYIVGATHRPRIHEQKNSKFRTDKFDTWNKRKFWLV